MDVGVQRGLQPVSLGAGWRSYVGGVVPGNAGPVQLEETRRAFYAGAWHLFNLLARLDGDEASDTAALDSIKAELDEYLAALSSIADRSRPHG